jgi:hypothetical protein
MSEKINWVNVRALQIEGMHGGHMLRIKQSVGAPNGPGAFWYCYRNGQYLGIEHTLELAKERSMSGRMRMPASELEECLQRYGKDLPPGLLASEKARLAEWKKNPASKAPKKVPEVSGGKEKVQAAKPAAPAPQAKPGVVKTRSIDGQTVVVKSRTNPFTKGTDRAKKIGYVLDRDGHTVGQLKKESEGLVDGWTIRQCIERGLVELK